MARWKWWCLPCTRSTHCAILPILYLPETDSLCLMKNSKSLVLPDMRSMSWSFALETNNEAIKGTHHLAFGGSYDLSTTKINNLIFVPGEGYFLARLTTSHHDITELFYWKWRETSTTQKKSNHTKRHAKLANFLSKIII